MDAIDSRESSLKELPTREMKLKRHKIRRDSPSIPPLRLRFKSNASFIHSETDAEKYSSDRSFSSSPDSASQEFSPVFTTDSHKAYQRISSVGNEYCNESGEAFNFSSNIESYDQPLDMSRKRTDSNITSTDCQSSHQQQLRPSVITCASALLRTQCNVSDLAHSMCTIKSDCDYNSNEIDSNLTLNHQQRSQSNNIEVKTERPGHRREVVSGSCDPVIDEHFRRSLGKEYQNIFMQSTGNNVSITVDDHFAKALGETWHQLQQSKSNTSSVSSEHSANSIQNQQTSRFLQSSEILL